MIETILLLAGTAIFIAIAVRMARTRGRTRTLYRIAAFTTLVLLVTVSMVVVEAAPDEATPCKFSCSS